MKLEIDKSDTIPIYKQIVIQFENLIKDGKCKAGEKLPTEKELCSENSVAIGTIKKAFDELEKKHYIKRVQGSGTFVARNEGNIDIEQAEKIVSDVFNKLSFVKSQQIYIVLEKELKRKFNRENFINVAWVDCSPENFPTTVKQINRISNLKVTPLLLEDIRRDNTLINLSYDFVATSNHHYRELLYLLSEEAPPIEKLVLEVSDETILKIAKLDEHDSIGVLYKSRNFVHNVIEKLQSINIKNSIGSFDYYGEFDEFKEFLLEVDVILVEADYKNSLSEDYLKALDEYEKRGHKIIPFIYQIDKGSLYGFSNKMKQFYKNKYEVRGINGF